MNVGVPSEAPVQAADADVAEGTNTERAPLLRESHGSEQTGTDSINDRELSNSRLAVVLGSIWIIVVLTALDSTIVATLTAVISTSFSSFNTFSWLGTAYLVATAATQPLAGQWTDIHGRRNGVLVGAAAFGIGTLICGMANKEWVFILGRAVAGAGGGAVVAVSTFVGADLVPLRKRGLIQGINNIAMSCGTGLGGVVGGVFNKWIGWKMAFLVQLPFALLGIFMCSIVPDIPSKPAEGPGPGRIDYLGSITLVMSIVLVLVGLNSGGNQVSWDHPLVWSTILASSVFFAIFIYVELYVAAEPIVPLPLMLRRTVWAGCVTYFFAHMAAFATMYYIPIYLQVRGNDPTQASLRFIAQSIGTATGAYGTGILIKATGNYVYFSMLAHAFLVAASVLASTMDWNTPAWCPFIYLGLTGLGFGGMVVTTMLALISSVDHSQHAVVTSASFAFRAIGSSCGITVASAIFQNALFQNLRETLGHGDSVNELIQSIRRNFDSIWDLPQETRVAVEDGYMRSLHSVFLAIALVSMASMASSLLLKQNMLHHNLSRR